jgi:hypothetical protein
MGQETPRKSDAHSRGSVERNLWTESKHSDTAVLAVVYNQRIQGPRGLQKYAANMRVECKAMARVWILNRSVVAYHSSTKMYYRDRFGANQFIQYVIFRTILVFLF